jgi:hypothetical protein
MHGETVKFTSAQQAKPSIIYMNTKLKLLKTNGAIWFNKICRNYHLQPKYISLKINGHTQQNRRTEANAIRFRINQDIRFQYKKKQHLNQQESGSHLHTVRVTGILNICCHNHDELIVLFKYFNNF